MANKKHRMNHILKENKRTFIVAMDHGNTFNVLPELKKPDQLIKDLAKSGVDAFLSTIGLLNRFGDAFMDKGVILRVDGGLSTLGGNDKPFQKAVSIEDALRLGADSVICMGFPGSKYEDISLKHLAHYVSECNKWGMPLVGEMLPRGFEGGEDSKTAENITFACRLGAEMGVDVIKTRYTGCKESFRELVESVYVPVVILGGSKMIQEEILLSTIRDSLDAGGAGVAMGRNIWKYPQPTRLSSAIAKMIHEDCNIEAALKELHKKVYVAPNFKNRH